MRHSSSLVNILKTDDKCTAIFSAVSARLSLWSAYFTARISWRKIASAAKKLSIVVDFSSVTLTVINDQRSAFEIVRFLSIFKWGNVWACCSKSAGYRKPVDIACMPSVTSFKKKLCFLVTPKKVELTFKLPFCMPSKQAYGSQICLRKTDKFLQIIQMI